MMGERRPSSAGNGIKDAFHASTVFYSPSVAHFDGDVVQEQFQQERIVRVRDWSDDVR